MLVEGLVTYADSVLSRFRSIEEVEELDLEAGLFDDPVSDDPAPDDVSDSVSSDTPMILKLSEVCRLWNNSSLREEYGDLTHGSVLGDYENEFVEISVWVPPEPSPPGDAFRDASVGGSIIAALLHLAAIEAISTGTLYIVTRE